MCDILSLIGPWDEAGTYVHCECGFERVERAGRPLDVSPGPKWWRSFRERCNFRCIGGEHEGQPCRVRNRYPGKRRRDVDRDHLSDVDLDHDRHVRRESR